jgi:Leucine-rich repeat (LRR) protein
VRRVVDLVQQLLKYAHTPVAEGLLATLEQGVQSWTHRAPVGLDEQRCKILRLIFSQQGEELESALEDLDQQKPLSKRLDQVEAGLDDYIDVTRVTELNLSHMGLTQVPAYLGTLPNLTDLDLSHNFLQAVPSAIQEMEALEDLDLSDNWITQFSCADWKCTHLTKLKLAQNELTQLPEDLEALEFLTDLDVEGNDLRSLPDALIRLQHLVTLNCSDNCITHISSQILRAGSLSEVSLSDNPLWEMSPAARVQLFSWPLLGRRDLINAFAVNTR